MLGEPLAMSKILSQTLEAIGDQSLLCCPEHMTLDTARLLTHSQGVSVRIGWCYPDAGDFPCRLRVAGDAGSTQGRMWDDGGSPIIGSAFGPRVAGRWRETRRNFGAMAAGSAYDQQGQEAEVWGTHDYTTLSMRTAHFLKSGSLLILSIASRVSRLMSSPSS